jgi:hypothetical protein
MAKLFSLMRKARRAIFFLVFLPSKGGVHSIVSEAVDLGTKDPSLTVLGAISDSQAMWVEQPTAAGATASGTPHVFNAGGVSVVRATALTDAEIGHPLGDFQFDEKLTAGKAIIHDKILVVDPMDRDRCVVAFGSHNGSAPCKPKRTPPEPATSGTDSCPRTRRGSTAPPGTSPATSRRERSRGAPATQPRSWRTVHNGDRPPKRALADHDCLAKAEIEHPTQCLELGIGVVGGATRVVAGAVPVEVDSGGDSLR